MARDPVQGRTGAAQLVATVLLAVPAWLGLGTAAVLVSGTGGAPTAITILSVIAGQLVVGAAGMSILRYWATGEVAPLLAAAGFLAYGTNKLVSVSFVRADSTGSTWQVIGNGSLLLAFGLLLVAVVHRPGTAGTRNPLSLWTGAIVGGLAALLLANPRGVGLLSNSGGGGLVGNVIVIAAWSGLALTAIYSGRSERDQMKIWIGFTAICLAQGRILFVVIGDLGLAELAQAVMQTIAITLMLFGTIRTVQEVIATDRGRLRDTIQAFQSIEARRREEADAHEEAVHNLRSALTTIGSATHLLVFGSKSPLSEADRSRLADSLQAELSRAQRLLRHEWDGGLERFQLLDVLTPLVINERAQNAVIDLEIPVGATLVGNPDRTYEVFATLFDNARKHARGAPVSVRLDATQGEPVVFVEDRGPGLPPSGGDHIFERGWSTSARRDGLGLGLFVARTLMEEQEGGLSATNRPGGGARFVVRFPATDAALASDQDALVG
jgi:signal transduction histidine kinase